MNKFAQKFFPLAALAALLLSGCAATQDADTDVAQRLEQGLRGQGRLVSPSPTGDSYGPYYQ